MVSMRKMQSLQPEVKAIQDRYAKYKMTDPERQKMNQEMMALYKQKGVNPASGCVPMLLTMPILFAFYAMLSASIELRGAPFFGWIHDLSLHDPVLHHARRSWARTMFWQQRMMPSTADPVQQKMFMFMPLIFTFMFLWAPSGLVVYWLVEQPAGDRPAVPDQPHDWRAGAAGAGAPARADSRRQEHRHPHERRSRRARSSTSCSSVLGAMGLDLDGRPSRRRRTTSGSTSPATGADVLLRRKGEALDALQVIVNTAFRRDARGDRHYVVDALGFRKDKDAELRQMARLLMEKAQDDRRAAGNRPAQSRTRAASCT